MPVLGHEACKEQAMAFQNHSPVIPAGKSHQGQYPVGSTAHIKFLLPTQFKNISLLGGSKALRKKPNNWTICKTIMFLSNQRGKDT